MVQVIIRRVIVVRCVQPGPIGARASGYLTTVTSGYPGAVVHFASARSVACQQSRGQQGIATVVQPNRPQLTWTHVALEPPLGCGLGRRNTPEAQWRAPAG